MSENKQQTAVELLVERLNKSIGLTNFVDNSNEEYKQEILVIIEQAKAMEKELAEKAFNSAKIIKNYKGERKFSYLDLDDYSDEKYETFEQYYNETYKSE